MKWKLASAFEKGLSIIPLFFFLIATILLCYPGGETYFFIIVRKCLYYKNHPVFKIF